MAWLVDKRACGAVPLPRFVARGIAPDDPMPVSVMVAAVERTSADAVAA